MYQLRYRVLAQIIKLLGQQTCTGLLCHSIAFHFPLRSPLFCSTLFSCRFCCCFSKLTRKSHKYKRPCTRYDLSYRRTLESNTACWFYMSLVYEDFHVMLLEQSNQEAGTMSLYTPPGPHCSARSPLMNVRWQSHRH